MKEQTNKGKYYCVICKEHSHTPQHNLCYEFKLFQIKEEQDKLAKRFDMLQRAYDYIDDFHCSHMTIEHYGTTDTEAQ
ncbi:hypothetical protein EB118_26095 [bacterium]|nr:hypothetical protein [bacterium]